MLGERHDSWGRKLSVILIYTLPVWLAEAFDSPGVSKAVLIIQEHI